MTKINIKKQSKSIDEAQNFQLIVIIYLSVLYFLSTWKG
jgi:hypothetical protein